MYLTSTKRNLLRIREEISEDWFDIDNIQKNVHSAHIEELDPSEPSRLKPGTVPSSSLANAIISCIKNTCAVGKNSTGYISEFEAANGDTHIATYSPSTHVLKACVVPYQDASQDEEITILPYKLSTAVPIGSSATPNGEFGEALLLAMFPEFLKDPEFATNFEVIKNNIGNKELCTKALAICSDNIDVRISAKNLKSYVPVNLEFEEGIVPKLTKMSIKNSSPTSSIFGDFKVLSLKKPNETKKVSNNFNGMYQFGTPSEEAEKIDCSKIVVPEIAHSICLHAMKSNSFRNFALRGPAGSGKSQIARICAAGWGKKHSIFTCSADTDSSALTGQIIPYIGEGEDNKSISYSFVSTPLLEAIRNGGVIEIQEPNVIIQPGVMVGLNGILEGSPIALPTGEIVHRHPDCVIFITTNVSYEGCRDMNVSVLDRMQMICDINCPPVEVLAERAASQTGFKDLKMLTEMASIVHDISDLMVSSGIEDGNVGLRALINWVESTKITEDAFSSALTTVISKVSSAKEDQQLALKRLNSSSFKTKRRKKI